MSWIFELHRTELIAHVIGALALVCMIGMVLSNLSAQVLTVLLFQ